MKKPGVRITLSDPEVSVEWKEVFLGLGEAAIGTALAVPTAGLTLSGLVKGALDSLKAIKLTDRVETRAFVLVTTAVAIATSKIVAKDIPVDEIRTSAAREIFRRLKEKSLTREFYIDGSIFLNPAATDFYRFVREDVAALVANLLPSPSVLVEECAAKLDAAFNHSIYDVLYTKREYFSLLEDHLSNAGSQAAQLEYDWARYRAGLIERFNVSPVFGQIDQSVALGQIYTVLGGRWKNSDSDFTYNLSHDLDSLLLDWAGNGEADDAIRLVFGGPGSGKSSLARSLAASLAASPNVRPILIELQYTSALGDLRQAIEQRLVHEAEWFHSDPLAQKDDNRPFVFIFDGLDELVVPGTTAASRVADGFVVALKALMRSFNGQAKLRARALVTGRSAIMHSFAKTYDVPPAAAIEILGFLYDEFDGAEHIHFDKRPEWWEKFALAYGYSSEIPQALIDSKVKDITAEPLLCFLMAMSGYMTSNWDDAANNINRIYAKLIGEIWERRWGQGEHASSGRVGPSLKLKSREDFNLLMETLALAAWWGGENRIATRAMFDWALDVTRAHDIWSSFREDDGDEMQNLALMFYMRRSEADGQGVEFTHKTFSEYLVARFMMRFAHLKISRQLDNRDIDLTEAASRWCTFAMQSRADSGVISFLQNEARLLSEGDLKLLHSMMAELLSHAHREGFPVHKIAATNFRALAESDVKAKVNALAVLSSATVALRDHSIEARVPIEWVDRSGPGRFIGTLVDYRGAQLSDALAFPNFDFTTESGVFCTSLFCCGADFSGANFQHAMLYKAFLSNCDFTSSVLASATVDLADLSNCTFNDADLSDLSAINTSFRDSDLRGANLKNAKITGCNIDRAIMDFNWWDEVDVRSFSRVPTGSPRLYLDGVLIDPGSAQYPDLNSVFASKYQAAVDAIADDVPF